MIDLLQATQDAFYAALVAGVPSERAKVLVHVKQDTTPPMVIIGAMTSENEANDGQIERIEVEIQTIYRGGDRGELLAIMHLVRAALDGVTISATGVYFGKPRYLGASASDVGPDGVTYAGISSFEVYTEPD